MIPEPRAGNHAAIHLRQNNPTTLPSSVKSIFSADGTQVVAAASTVDKDLRTALANGGNTSAAAAVGKRVAEKAIKAGVQAVAFDRAGYRYHGRVKALAEAAREAGLKF